MHILFATLTKMDRSRGDAVHVAELARALSAQGERVTVIGLGSSQHALGGAAYINAGNVAAGPAPLRRLSSLLVFVRACVRTLRLQRQADVLYSRHALLAGTVACLAPGTKTPMVYEANSLLLDEKALLSPTLLGRLSGRILQGMEKLTVRRAKAVVCVTEGIRRILAEEYGTPAERLHVVSNGVNLELFTPAADPEQQQRLREALGLDEHDAVILYLGALEPWQDIFTLLRAVAQLEPGARRPVLVIVGDGTTRRGLESEAAHLAGRTRVVFTGTIPHADVPAYIRLADVCAMPFTRTRNERIGLSPMKLFAYLACGKYVVSSRVPGLEFIADEGLGELTPCGDADAMAAALARRLAEPAGRADAERRARDHAEQHCGWERAAREVLEVCRTALGNRDVQAGSR